jgi:hypothetical protein
MTPVFVYLGDEPEDEFADVTLPVAFTCHRLDTNEAQAVVAGQDLDSVLSDLVDVGCTLELYERALQESEQHSERATKARAALRHAIDALEPVYDGLDTARSALITHWGDPPRTHTAGHGPQPPRPCAAMTRLDAARLPVPP